MPPELDLPRTPEAASIARRWLESRYDGNLADAALQNMKLVVSELVNNAVLHGIGDIRMSVTLAEGRMRVTVEDEGVNSPPIMTVQPRPGSGGFGLRVVDALAVAWGVRDGASHVWVDLPTS